MRILAGMLVLGALAACGEEQFAAGGEAATGGKAGSGGDAGSGEGDPTPANVRDASQRLARASCEYYERCVIFRARYGDLETCTAFLADLWADLFASPNTRFTLAEMDSCAAEYANLSCSDVECTVKLSPGRVPLGSACGSSRLECESGYCASAGDGCNVCVPHSKEGGPCDTACEPGLSCTGQVCRKTEPEGGACDDERPCASRHRCVEGVCVREARAGEACSRSDWPQCEAGFACDADTAICTARSYVGDGEVCEAVDACAVGDCKTVAGKEICFARALPGEACGTRECVGDLPCENGVCARASLDASCD